MAKLLIVEDDLDVAEMLAAYLRSLDYSLAEAHDGQTAIDILRSDDGQISALCYSVLTASGLIARCG